MNKLEELIEYPEQLNKFEQKLKECGIDNENLRIELRNNLNDIVQQHIDKNYIRKEKVRVQINGFENANKTRNNDLLQKIINLLNQLIK